MKSVSYIAKAMIVFLALSANSFSTAIADKQAELLLIKAPDKVGSLVVGKSNYADVISILGNPDFAESKKITITNQEILDLKYPLKGIEFTIDKNKQMRVARIEVYKPFAGSSAEGGKRGQGRIVFQRRT